MFLYSVPKIKASIDFDENKLKEILKIENVFFAYTSENRIKQSLDNIEYNETISSNTQLIVNSIDEGLISIEQALLALRYTSSNNSIESTLNTMGLLMDEEFNKKLV